METAGKIKSILEKLKEWYIGDYIIAVLIIAVIGMSIWVSILRGDLESAERARAQYAEMYAAEVEGSQKMADTIAEQQVEINTLQAELDERTTLEGEMVSEIERMNQVIAEKENEIASLK